MTRFRKRIGEAGCEFMLSLTVVAGISTQTVSQTSLTVVNVDSTVQEKSDQLAPLMLGCITRLEVRW